MPRFFIATPPAGLSEVLLDADETRHAVSVFRVKKNDTLELFDGAGRRFLGIAGGVSEGRLAVRLTEVTLSPFPSPVQVSLGAAVFRPERMEILIQKSCELGAHAVIPLLTERGIVKLSEDRWRSKVVRWQKIIHESCKQCGLAYAPEVPAPRPFNSFIAEIKNYDLTLIPTLEGTTIPMGEALPVSPPRRILVLIGPEGDFSPAEKKSAMDAGAKAVSLGPLVLRSETAGIYALSAIHFFYREVNVEKK